MGEPAGASPSARLAKGRWAHVLVALSAAAIVLARMAAQNVRALDKVWAEDGLVFLVDARRHGIAAFGYEYAGYSNLLPRVEAAIGNLLPLQDYAFWCAAVAALTVGVLAAVVRWSVLRVTGSQLAAGAAALSMVGTGSLAGESLATISNLQWFLAPALACLFLVPDLRRRETLVVAAFTLIVGLSGPLPILIAPLLLLRGWRHTSRPITLALALSIITQGLFHVLSPVSSPDHQPARKTGFPPGFAKHLVEVLGGTTSHTALLGCVWLVAAAAVLVTTRSRTATGLAAVGALVLVVTSVGSGEVTQRYVGCAATFVLIAATIAAVSAPRTVTAAAATVLVILSVIAFPVSTFRTSGQPFRHQVRAAATTCSARGEATFAWAPAGFPMSVVPC